MVLIGVVGPMLDRRYVCSVFLSAQEDELRERDVCVKLTALETVLRDLQEYSHAFVRRPAKYSICQYTSAVKRVLTLL